MKREKHKDFGLAISVLAAFLIWTAAVGYVDVQPIGPAGSSVGFATVNQFVHNLLGVRMTLYTLTDWLGLVPLGSAFGFALLGLGQWLKRKQLRKVDYSILVLGGFYVAVMAAYAFFEVFVINCRPVLIEGRLEASYPSSTTMLVMCVMPTAIMQLRARIKNKRFRGLVTAAITAYIVFMVIGRMMSGVHWLSDIIGGALLSTGLVLLYRAAVNIAHQQNFKC